MQNIRNPIKSDRNNHVIEIDQSCFRHSAKYGRERKSEKEIWVFSLIDRQSESKVSYFEVVENRSSDTLLPIIQAICLPAIVIHSDNWVSYLIIWEQLGFEHHMVNHSNRKHRFIFTNEIHTQLIKSY